MKISIIIPVYNAQKYLCECLDSVVNQKNEDKEIIIINDGSTDSTEQICMNYVKKYSFIKYISSENKGVSAARNKGIEVSTGDWITFLDADDKIQSNSFVLFERLIKKSDVIVCDYSRSEIENCLEMNYTLVDISKEKMIRAILNLPQYYKEIRETSYKIDGTNNWTCWGKFFKSEIIKKNNVKFVEGVTHGEDLIFCYELYKYAKNISYFPINLYYYRTNNVSVSRTFNNKRLENTFALFENLKKCYEPVHDDKDFQNFIVDRVIASCILYYSNKNNIMTFREKCESLKEVCSIDYINHAIKTCPAKKLSIGKKTNLLYIILLIMLKMKLYGNVIKFTSLMYG